MLQHVLKDVLCVTACPQGRFVCYSMSSMAFSRTFCALQHFLTDVSRVAGCPQGAAAGEVAASSRPLRPPASRRLPLLLQLVPHRLRRQRPDGRLPPHLGRLPLRGIKGPVWLPSILTELNQIKLN